MKQQRIRCCSNTLLCCAFLVTVLCVLMGVFTVMIGDNETLNILISTAMHQGQKMSGQEMPKEVQDVKPIVVIGGIMIAISVLGILMAICARITMNCICVTFEVVVLLAVAVVLLLFGTLLVIPAFWGVGYIQSNCDLVTQGKTNDIDQYSREIFEPMDELDKAFQTGVNQQMCTRFCACPGDLSSEHYKKYQDIPEETYKKYNRTFYPAADLEKDKQTDPAAYREAILKDKSLFWLPEVAENADILTETMLQCYDNAVKIQVELAKDDPEIAEKKQKQLEEAKPDKVFIDIVSHVENKYSCSGLCRKPLFFFTQSVKKGPPQTPCLEPLIEDISETLKQLGIAFVLAGLFFFMMIYISLPICCYSVEEEAAEKDAEMQTRGLRSEMYEV